MASSILVLAAGITGLTTALALHKYLPSPRPNITIYELRLTPSTIGGAVNLTPKALRYLNHLGVYDIFKAKNIGVEGKTIELRDVYTGTKYAEVDFRSTDGEGIGKEGSKFFARRVMRFDLSSALLELVSGLEGVEVMCGRKVVGIEENADEVRLTFEDGEVVGGDCLLGCDGIHSATRTLLVDAERKPNYTGISVAMATSTLREGEKSPPWTTTGLVSSRRGSLLCSYFEPTRSRHYVGAAMEIADVGSREGWRVRGVDQETIKKDLLDRFANENVPANAAILEGVDEWTLYPVYALPEGGKWRSELGRVVLLGDAAHAMPPQGESTGICIEDAIVFSRAMIQHTAKPLPSILAAYEAFRQPCTDRAVQEATWRFETVKDKSWLTYQLIMRATSWFLWCTAAKRQAEFEEDLSGVAV